MIDNFELIKSMFYFNEANNMFFHCQIVQRAKDHKPNKVGESAIKTYFIRSREHLDRVKDEIILLCEHYGARAYINVAGKDFDAMQKLMLMKLARNVTENIIQNPRKILNSAAGELKSRRPLWIVDIDDMSMRDSIEEYLIGLYAEKMINTKPYHMPNGVEILPNYKEHPELALEVIRECKEFFIHAEVPTHQGVHLIADPFNLKKFSEAFPEVDVHKNSMGTLLYYPKSLELPKYCCSVCGGTNIQLQAWIDPNNNNRYIEDTEDDECWCEDCQGHTKIKKINE